MSAKEPLALRTMGATIPYGRDFKQETQRAGVREFVYLIPIDGDFLSRSYSTVEETVAYCEVLGIDRQIWPEFYDNDDMDIPLNVVKEKNSQLKRALSKLSESEINGNRFLPELWALMRQGMIFYITT